MSTQTLVFVERLTAPKPDWILAVVAAKGVQPVPIGVKYARCRRNGDYLIISITGVPAPDKQDYVCDLETHVHIDEIVHVDFYNNLKLAPKRQEPPAEKTDLIMPTQGEIDAAKTGKLERV